MTVTNMFIRLMPLAVFASMTIMIVDTGGESLLYILAAVGVFLLATAVMLCVYGLFVLVLGRSNPFAFYRKIKEGMLTSFILSSSSAAPADQSENMH